MILRKPYAFLIKYFKVIHLVLSFLLVYVAYKTYGVYQFIQYYIKEGWNYGFTFTTTDYINIFIYGAILLIISILLVVLLLMRKKEKPTLIYMINIGVYFLIFIIFVFSYTNMQAMEMDKIDTRIVKLILDINLASFIIQSILLVFMLQRALGFDIKKFNFGEDIAELKVEMADNEEVEVNLNVNTDNIITNVRRQKREFKYIYQENKLYINILIALFILIAGFVIYLNVTVYNKIYKENEVFKASYLNVKIVDSYVTKEDYKDKVITNEGDSYLVVKMSVTNPYKAELSFNIDNYKLISGSSIYKATTQKYNRLFDLGYGYSDEKIVGKTTEEYILVFLIDDRSLGHNMYLRYKNQMKFYVGRIEANYKKIKLSPSDIDVENKVISNSNLKEKLVFKNSLLKDATIQINSYNIKDSEAYIYDYCKETVCNKIQDIIKPNSNSNYDKTLLSLDLDLDLGDYKLYGVNSKFDFVNKFGTIHYTINGKTKKHTVALYDRTPNKYTGNNIYIEVLDEVKKASNIYITFEIRDKEYTYNLK